MNIIEFGFKSFHTICGVCGTHMEYTLDDMDFSYDKLLVECPACGTKCVHTKDNGYVRFTREEIENSKEENSAANQRKQIGFGREEE